MGIPPGPNFISDVIFSSPILAGDNGVPDESMADGAGAGPAAGGSGAGGAGFEFGVDPTLDPELAMALRMSMEEEQARQAAAAAAQQSSEAPAAAAAASGSLSESRASESVPAAASDDDEDALLQQALAMSEEPKTDVEMTPAENATGGSAAPGEEDEEMDEDEAIQKAIEMSMRGEGGDGESK